MTTRIRAALVVVAIVVLSVVITGAERAWAHAALLSGTPTCLQTGEHQITWTISNDFNLVMTVDSATTTYGPATVATNPVAKLGSTAANSTAPGSATGLVTLTVHATWSDEFNSTFSGTVNLPDPCPGPTTTTSGPTTTTGATTTSTGPTTTTAPPPSTTGPPSTTTLPPPGSTTTGPPDSTTIPPPVSSTTGPPDSTSSSIGPSTSSIPPPPDHCTPGVPPCAHTGSDTGPLLGLGATLAFTGLALLFGSRYRRTVSQ